jgi:GT2 family glycosyltransferase
VLPFTSVVVPTFNRPEPLRACLAALAALRYPRARFEVIVVDDGGAAPLDALVEPYEARLRLRLHRQPNAGPAAARNAGAALARGELLAFTDDDCQPEPDWLDALGNRAVHAPYHMIGGVTVNALPDNVYSSASQQLISYLYEYSERQRPGARWRGFFASNNLAVPRSGFERLGGFDEAFPLAAGEDRDFCERWAGHGLPMLLAPDARVRHAHHLTFTRFWRQHWMYGRGAFHLHAARRRRGDGELNPEPLSFYLDLVRYPIRTQRSLQHMLQAALLGASQVANLLGYLREGQVVRTEKRRH